MSFVDSHLFARCNVDHSSQCFWRTNSKITRKCV